MKNGLIGIVLCFLGIFVGYYGLPKKTCMDGRPYIKIVLQDNEVMVSDRPFLSTSGAYGMITIDGVPVSSVDVSNVVFKIDSTGSFYGGPANVINCELIYD